MPELGAMPLRGQLARGERVVRLVSTTPGANLSIELFPGTNKIGRQREDNHIVLVSPQISRFHAEIDVAGPEFLLRDLGSGNGTYLNGSRITEHALQAGDLIAFSDKFTFRVLVDLTTEPPETLTLEADDSPEAPARGTPASNPVPVRPLAPDAVPDSLAERAQALRRSSPGLDTDALRALSETSPPVQVAPEHPVEISEASHPPVQTPAHEPGRARPIPIPQEEQPEAEQRQKRVERPAAELPHGARTTLPGVTGARPPARPAAPPPSVSIRSAAPAPNDATEQRIQRERRRSTLTGETAPPEAQSSDVLDREKRRVSMLYQVSKRCMGARSLAELDAVLVNVLERSSAFDRGFVAYQLPARDWKLVISPKGDRWEKRVVRQLLQLALRAEGPLSVEDSQRDPRLGTAPDGRSDQRLLLPLRSREASMGAIFLVTARPNVFESETIDFLNLFSDIAALAIASVSRLEQ